MCMSFWEHHFYWTYHLKVRIQDRNFDLAMFGSSPTRSSNKYIDSYIWGCSSIGRAGPLHGSGCRFDACHFHTVSQQSREVRSISFGSYVENKVAVGWNVYTNHSGLISRRYLVRLQLPQLCSLFRWKQFLVYKIHLQRLELPNRR